MNVKIIVTLFVLFSLAFGTTTTYAYADHVTASVSISAKSGVPGCEENDMCYIPSEVSVDMGGKVIWTNDDTAVHTVTSGSASAVGPNGKFDSSLINSGASFSHKFAEDGLYNYFCIVHPWMEGNIIVGENINVENVFIDAQLDKALGEIAYNIRTTDTHSEFVTLTVLAPNANIVNIEQNELSNGISKGTINIKTSGFSADGYYTLIATVGSYQDETKIKISSETITNHTSFKNTERTHVSNVRIVDMQGATLSSVKINQQVLITADIQNKQNIDQSYAYLIQIKDSDDAVIFLSWIKGTFPSNYVTSPAQSWSSTNNGEYTITVYVWESIDKPIPLSPVNKININISN